MEDKVLHDVLQVMLDNKAEDLVYLNVEKVNPYAAYYIICSVSSNRHALALAKYVDDEFAKNNICVKHIEGNSLVFTILCGSFRLWQWLNYLSLPAHPLLYQVIFQQNLSIT